MTRFAAISQHVAELNGLDGITLPILGKHYFIKSPDAGTGMEIVEIMSKLSKSANGEDLTPEEVDEIVEADKRAGGNLIARALGPALNEMIADSVPFTYVRLSFATVLHWISQSEEVAALYWAAAGGDLGKATGPQDRKASARTKTSSTRNQGSPSSRGRKPTATTPGA